MSRGKNLAKQYGRRRDKATITQAKSRQEQLHLVTFSDTASVFHIVVVVPMIALIEIVIVIEILIVIVILIA